MKIKRRFYSQNGEEKKKLPKKKKPFIKSVGVAMSEKI